MSDILLSVGLQKGSAETSQIRSDLQSIISQIDKNPPKVKVGLQIDQSAINHFKSQLTQIVNSVGLSKGAPITVNISGIGEITAQATKAKGALDGVAESGKKAADTVKLMSAKKSADAIARINRELMKMQENQKNWTASKSGSSSDAYSVYSKQIEELIILKGQVEANVISAENFALKLSQIQAAATGAAASIKAVGEDRTAEVVKKLTINTEEYQKALGQTEELLARVKKRQEEWTAAKSGKSSDAYRNLDTYRTEIEALLAKLQSGEMTVKQFASAFSDVQNKVKAAEGTIRAAGENTKTLGDRLKGLASKFGAWFSVSQVVMQAVRAIKQMVVAVREIDTAMTELKKVTNETSATYNEFLANAGARAKQVGASISDIVTSTSNFARLGYDIDAASSLADTAIIYKNIGDGIEDITTASESIISTMQAFGIEAANAMSIVDKFNEVGNNFAISSAGIGDAMQRSAAAMASANNTIDETIALITAANTIVQNPESVGTTMKTISMYLRAAKTEAEEAGESTDGMANSVSELRQEILDLTGQRVDIQLDEDTFKSTYQILQELSKVWGSLTDVSQANLLEMIGGKRNANVVSALLENFSVAENALKSSMKSAGSALKENEKHLDSINGKIEVFKAAFQELSVDLIGTSFVKGFVDFGTFLIEMLDIIAKIVDAVGGLNTALTTTLSMLVLFKGKAIADFFSKIIDKVKLFSVDLRAMGMVFTKLKSQGKGTLDALSKSFVALGVSVSAFQIIAAAAIAVIGIAITVYQKFKQAQEEARQSAINNAKSAADLSSEISSLIGKYSALTEEVKSDASAKESLIATQNELIKKLGLEQYEIDKLVDKYGNLSDAIRQASIDALKVNERDLRAGISAYAEELVKIANKEGTDAISFSGQITGNLWERIFGNIFGFSEETMNKRIQLYKGLNALKEAGYINKELVPHTTDDGEAYSTGFALWVGENLDTVDGAIAAYEKIGKMLDVVGDTIGEDNVLYESLYTKYDKMSESARGYLDTVNSLNTVLAEQYIHQKLIGSEIPNTQEEFDEYRQSVIDAAIESDEFHGSIDMIIGSIDGVLKNDTTFSKFYDDIDYEVLSRANKIKTIAESLLDGKFIGKEDNWHAMEGYLDMLSRYQEVLSVLSDEEIRVAKIVIDEQDIGSVEELIVAIKKYQQQPSYRSAYAKTAISSLWGSKDFSSTKEELISIAKTANGITAQKIKELASESKDLANILEIDGMNAAFLANVLMYMGQGYDGLSLITSEALQLNEALDGMVDEFNKVTAAKKRYDEVMSVDEKDTNFKSMADAFKVLNDEFVAGTTNSNSFWAAAEYIFGADQLSQWGWADGLQHIYNAMKENVSVFEDAESAGLGFLERLYEISESGKVVDAEGNVLAEISKLSDGSFEFNIDYENISGLASVMNLSEEAVLACVEALSMWGDIDFYNIEDVMKVIEDVGLATEIAGKKAVNVDDLIEQFVALGKTKKEIKDIIDGLKDLDGVHLISVDMEISDLISSIEEMGIAASDGTTIQVDYVQLTNLMRELKLSKEEAQQLVQNLGNVDGVQFTNQLGAGTGGITDVQGVMDYINTVDFAPAEGEVDSVIGAVNNLINTLDGMDGKQISVTIDIVGTATQAVKDIKGLLGYADGTSNAQEGPALVGEEGEELVQSGNRAYFVGSYGPELTYLKSGDRVYTAEETKRIKKSGKRISGFIPAFSGGGVYGGFSVKKWDSVLSGGSGGSSGSSSASKSSKSSSSSTKNSESEFERLYKYHQHLLAMDAENVADYLDWLDGAYKNAYDKGAIDLDEYYKYQEEVYKGTQDLFKDYLNDIDHEVSLLEGAAGNSDEVIAIIVSTMADVEKELAAARAAGLDENGEYIQFLEKQWADYSQTVIDLREKAESEAESTIDNLVEYRIDMLKKEIELDKEALDKKLSDLQDFYDKQREMLQDQYDEEKYLEEQHEKRKSVSDIRADLAMLEHDNSAWAQKRKLELQEELADAEKELNSFERDHALDMTLDVLDKQQEEAEKQIQAEMDALEAKLNDPHALFNQALEDIKNNTAELYQEFIDYNRKYGTGNDQDVDDMWEDAFKAFLEYVDTHDGQFPDGIQIGNYTGYVIPEAPTPPQPEEKPSSEQPEQKEEPKPSLEKGSSVQIKSSATRFSAKSGNLRMASFVPGSTYTVYKTSGEEVLVGDDGVYIGWVNKSDIVGYKSGTGYSAGGIAEFDEEGRGSEYIFESSDGSRYRMFAEGSKVLDANATDFLYSFATTGGTFLTKMLSDLLGLSGIGSLNKPVQAIDIHSGDIIVQGNANERTVSEIRRAQRDNLEFVLKELNRLNR